MITQIRIELLKLTSTRLGYTLLAVGTGLTAMFAILESTQAGKGGGFAPPPLYTAGGFTQVFSGGVWGLMFAAVLGVTAITSESRHQTATVTYLATPDRNRVLTAKMLASALVGAVFGLAGYLVAGATAFGFALSHGYHIPLGDGTLARIGAGNLLAGALLAALGTAAGALLRSQLAGIVAVFVWSIILESLFVGLFPAAARFLPYTAATNLAGTQLGGAAFGPAHGTSATTPLPFAVTVALLAAMTIALAAVAARTTVRRDIS